ncbi:thiopurine S-methyltransferase [Alteromonas sp. a30]|uniref:thiopurine S-methyltransferase n=1 Tax=Alteromonas sp. a30 TaxID=2730917 RepID=UPI00228021D4|nr:thiopurine S-methyltransferase [Alteromonas sp. a30]MCY7295777.1 thiopurine S-methyltransferase [Alteromonas sp. a30]
MQADFWHQKWESNDIAFHEREVNPLLVANIDKLKLPEAARIFLPLCGKTLDIAWLISKGYTVIGAELSELAIQQLFDSLNVSPKVQDIGELKLYQASQLNVFVGDIFNITQEQIGQIDAIYDRAALVALPSEMREQYCKHLVQISKRAPQLVICFEYDQSVMSGPPFSIDEKEVRAHYEQYYTVTLADKQQYYAKIKRKVAPIEEVWLLN